MQSIPASPNNEYAVGIITAIPLELTAARACLDEVHSKPRSKNPSDNNTYSLGRIGDHKVVMACLPNGVYGTTSAAIVASQMLSSFPSIRFGLMVGIGGAAPSKKHDLRLGDLVVSEPSGQFGGVVQYDLGKRTSTGFQLKGLLNKPPQVLLGAVSRLKSDNMMGIDEIAIHLSEMVAKYPTMKSKFSKQDITTDRLFQSDNPHIPGDTVTRDELANLYDVLCFEMEAAGLMDNFPCLVIRGICDYSDSHKNDLWQEHAAAVAAAYAKNLLSIMDGSDVTAKWKKHLKSLVSDPRFLSFNKQLVQLQSTSDLILKAENERLLQLKKETELKALGVFKTSKYESHKARNPDRVVGTCGWFFQHKIYLGWRENSADVLLWVSADPGAGKSVLAKSLIENELASHQQLSTCYFFFKDDNKEQQKVSTALCALLHQLYTQRPTLLSKEADLVLKEGGDLHEDFHALWRVLNRAAVRPEAGNVICILDALDEGEPSHILSLIELLNHFQKKAKVNFDTRGRPTTFKFLVTSRPYFSIQSRFQEIIADFLTIHLSGEMESATVEEEISLVIKCRVPQIAARLRPDTTVADALQEKLLKIPHRTYLWLHLMLEELQSLRSLDRTQKRLTKMLDTLPHTVNEAYEKILERRIHKRDARKILHVVLAAQHPLTLQEMNIILALEDETDTYADLDLEDNDHIGEKIRNICGLFISVSQSKVYLCHQTAREFLLCHAYACTHRSSKSLSFQWKHTFHLQDSNMIMARICMAFLLIKDFYLDSAILLYTAQEYEEDSMSKFTQEFHFLYYAATHWAEHFLRIQPDGRRPMMHLIHKLCETQRLRHSCWYLIYWRYVLLKIITGYCDDSDSFGADSELKKVSMISMPHVTGLTLITTFGCPELVQFFLSSGSDINERVNYFGSALTTATIYGHHQVVSLLLENGAVIDGDAHSYGTALHVAACMGNKPMVELLLTQGANINARGGVHGSAILAALSGHYDSIVEFLILKGSDMQGENIWKENVLTLASEFGNLALVQAALQKGVVDKIGHALNRATGAGHDSIKHALIEHDVDIDTEAGRYTVANRKTQRKVIREWHARHGVPVKEHQIASQESASRHYENNAMYHGRRSRLMRSKANFI